LLIIFQIGWERNLIAEGIEANPGPTGWGTFVKLIIEDQDESFMDANFLDFLRGPFRLAVSKLVQNNELMNEDHIGKYMQTVDAKQIPENYARVINQILSDIREGKENVEKNYFLLLQLENVKF
jgi:hypothetical protein